MPEIKLHSYVGEDGILHLNLPFEFKGAKVDVTITVQDECLEEDLSQLEWHEFLERTAGSINDESFVRHPQGDYDLRERLE